MSSEGEGYIGNIAGIALREQERLDQQLMLLMGEVESVKTEKRKVDAVLKALNGSVAKSGPKPKRKPPQQIRKGIREAAIEFVTGKEEEITSSKIREALGTSGTYAAKICDVLRDEGILRLSATQGTKKIYRSMV